MADIGRHIETVRVPRRERATEIGPVVPTRRENDAPPARIPLPQELDFLSVPVRRTNQ